MIEMSKGVYTELVDALIQYNGIEAKIGERYGIDVEGLHLHCAKFELFMNNKFIILYDVSGFEIVEININRITDISICKTDYWNTVSALYHKGVSD